jgi:hypothetical protein
MEIVITMSPLVGLIPSFHGGIDVLIVHHELYDSRFLGMQRLPENIQHQVSMWYSSF